MAKANVAKATQDYVPIEEIRDGLLVLKNGELRAIVMASSLNFALKSADEQQAIITNFQDFLNSLDFPIQIFVQSRKVNLDPYITRLNDAFKEQANELLQIQIREYIEFIKTIVSSTEIVTKSFYVVVPFIHKAGPQLPKGGIGGILGFLSASWRTKKENILSPEQFDEYKEQLQQRVSGIISGMARFGVRAIPLNTEEAIELFYGLYNPGGLERGGPINTAPGEQQAATNKQLAAGN